MISEAIRILGRWKAGEVPPPEEVQIYPTNRCNLRCRFCVTTTGFYHGQPEVPTERWLSVAEELCRMGVRRVLISGGGEPLLSDATLPMMRRFMDSRMQGRMITNGTAWTPGSIDAAVSMGWNQVTFSIDAPRADLHDRLRGVPGSFSRAARTIETFNKEKKKFDSDSPRLEINYVLNRENFSYITEMVAFAAGKGISHLNIEPVCINSPGAQSLRLQEEERADLQNTILPVARDLAQESGLSTNIPALLEIGNVERAGEMRGFILNKLGPAVPEAPFLEMACYEPWLWPKIEANGAVWPCSTVPLKESIMDKGFREIWAGPVFREYRKRIMERNLPESCQNCVVSHLTTNNALRSAIRDNYAHRDSPWKHK